MSMTECPHCGKGHVCHVDEQLFKLTKWANIHEGDHVWFMGHVMLITGERFRRNEEPYDQFREGWMRFPVKDETGAEFAPPVELTDRVAKLEER